eukprot:gene12498-15269_t
MFGVRSPYAPLKHALLAGQIKWAVSSAILLEYEEVVVRYADSARWQKVARLLELLTETHESVIRVTPSFHFRTIIHDQDDDIFADTAITVSADYILTHDRHFEVLK